VCSELRVLIIDDLLRTRLSLKALLTTYPFIKEVQDAETGWQGISLIEQAQPDVVLVDARMPDMDGIATTRQIKQRWPHITVIVMSLYSEYGADALAAGADTFFSKGEPPESLLAVMCRCRVEKRL
jgi:DNA-binding NarL/FixJ family response regulator